MNVSKLLVETFEKENPKLMTAIKQAVDAGESRTHFIMFLKQTFGGQYKTSVTAHLSVTAFDYYKELKKT